MLHDPPIWYGVTETKVSDVGSVKVKSSRDLTYLTSLASYNAQQITTEITTVYVATIAH